MIWCLGDRHSSPFLNYVTDVAEIYLVTLCFQIQTANLADVEQDEEE